MNGQDTLHLHDILRSLQSLRELLERKKTAQPAGSRQIRAILKAIKKVSPETRTTFTQVSWSTLGNWSKPPPLDELARVGAQIEEVFQALSKPSHPWRMCPAGKHWVREHSRQISKGATTVGAHCALNPSHKDQLYPDEIREIAQARFKDLAQNISNSDLGFEDGNKFNSLVVGWVRYWNDVLKSENPLDPNIIKVLIASESSFKLRPTDGNAGRGNKARGILQITDQTRKIMNDTKGELKDHFITLTREEV